MGVVLHWFLPTNGDSRTDLSLGNAVGAAGSRVREGGAVLAKVGLDRGAFACALNKPRKLPTAAFCSGSSPQPVGCSAFSAHPWSGAASLGSVFN